MARTPKPEIPPGLVVAGGRLRCPACGGTVLKERSPGRARCETWLLTCAYCDGFEQLVEVDAGGAARTVARRRLEEAPNRTDLRGDGTPSKSNSSVFRPTCKVRSCGTPAEEYGLCGPHLSQCRVAGRLADAERWAQEKSPPRPRRAKRAKRVKTAEKPQQPRKPQAAPVAAKPTPAAKAPTPATPARCRAGGCKHTGYGEHQLCSTHLARWRMCGEPKLSTWLGVGAPTATRWKTMQPRRAGEGSPS